jgi:hypothetical protein
MNLTASISGGRRPAICAMLSEANGAGGASTATSQPHHAGSELAPPQQLVEPGESRSISPAAAPVSSPLRLTGTPTCQGTSRISPADRMTYCVAVSNARPVWQTSPD